MGKTALVTTNWSSDPYDVLDRREEEMKGEHWKPLIENGLRVFRFQRNMASAWVIINSLLNRTNNLDLQIGVDSTEGESLYFVCHENPDSKTSPDPRKIKESLISKFKRFFI
jgi:hypothetical protein